MIESFLKLLGIGNFFLVITLLVFVHEWGHYWVARACRVKVLTFSIGFGPKIFSFTDKKNTEWRLSWLPLGGFVRMLGEMLPVPKERQQAMDKEIGEKDLPHAFHKKKVWQRFLIVAAGPIANFIFAFLLLIFMAMALGVPKAIDRSANLSATISQVAPNSSAEYGGMAVGDKILQMDDTVITDYQQVITFMQQSQGDVINIMVERNGENILLNIRPNPSGSVDGKTSYRLGIGLGNVAPPDLEKVGFVDAVQYGWDESLRLSTLMFQGIKGLLTGEIGFDQLGGPVMIAKMSGDAGAAGIHSLLFFIVLLSLNLGIINLFPIPVLDGGHLVLLAIEQIIGRPLPQAIQQAMMMAGMAFLLFLFLAITLKDIWQIFLQ